MAKRKVGTGITRHERITWNLLDPAEREAADKETDDFIWPHGNFPAWLDQREARVALALEHFKLPKPNRRIVYNKEKPRDWRYEDDLMTPAQRTEWYLQVFPYQSSFWYFGRLLFHISQCRLAIKGERWLELAGRALELGRVDRELQLKFSGEKRLQSFERHVSASDKGNQTRKAKADRWKAEARRIVASHPDIDLDNASKAARDVLKAWPKDKPSPPRALRRYLGELAKRAVLPEMKTIR